MKRIYTNISILAIVALMLASCESVSRVSNEPEAPVMYIIDGDDFAGNISNECIYRMLDMAYSGHNVTFSTEGQHQSSVSGAETITYRTSNREAAFRWARRMSHNGYTITVSYNKRNGKYYCKATK